MPRRVNLPGADELFGGTQASTDQHETVRRTSVETAQVAGPTGRVRHDEKITVYVSTDELISLEQARLRLRAELGVNVDRGRLVREAIDMLVDDLSANGEQSLVVQRLMR